MLKTNSTIVTKNQLLDYVSKRKFNDFVADMQDFRDETGLRFGVVDKRLSNLDRKFEELKEDMRVRVGTILDQFKENMQINMEYMIGLEERLTNRIQRSEDKIR